MNDDREREAKVIMKNKGYRLYVMFVMLPASYGQQLGRVIVRI